jgi:hypothetical protein
LVLPFGIEIVSPQEFVIASALSFSLLAGAALVSAARTPILILPLFAAFWLPNWNAHWTRLLLEFSFLFLFAGHVFAKCQICSIAARRLDIRNIADQLVTNASLDEICARVRRHVRIAPIVLSLTTLNVLAIVILQFAPLPMSLYERHVVQVLLLVGIGLLFLDARALVWQGMWLRLAGQSLQQSLLLVLALPWAIGWIPYALHTGNMGDNEAVGVFILWFTSSCAISSFIGSGAKSKLQISLRELVSENL